MVSSPSKHVTRGPSRRSVHKKNIEITSSISKILLGNTQWEFFDGIPKHVSLRTRLRVKLQYSSFGLKWEMFQTVFAMFVSILYVMQTYDSDYKMDSFELAALIVFSFDYLLNFYCCENRYRYVFSFTSIVDLITIVPGILDRATSDGHNSKGISLSFLRFVRVLRLLRLTRLIRAISSRSISAVQKQIHTISLLIVCIMFISAGVFHAVESDNEYRVRKLTFGDALYFLTVTMSTVGYGDITPLTSIGKAVTAAVIICAFTIIPRELSRLNQLVALQSQFRKVYQPSVGNPHILVVGYVTDARVLLEFFRELYHPDRLFGDYKNTSNPLSDPPCVLMGPNEPDESIIALLDHPILQNRVTYIKGSVMSEGDLCRVGVDGARACFVLTQKSSSNTKRHDADTILRMLALRNYNADLEIYSQINSPAFTDYISRMEKDHVLCLDELKLSLIARSCLCPGLIPLISNMFRSASKSKQGDEHGWEKQYIDGLTLEVYATKLPSLYYGLTFAQACDIVYKSTQGEVILMGVYERNSQPHHEESSPLKSGNENQSLPSLKVQTMNPITHPCSRMVINPGSTMSMAQGQTVYVLSESKKWAQMETIEEQLNEWLANGNQIPHPAPREYPMVNIAQTNSMTPPHTPTRSSCTRNYVLEQAIHPITNEPLTSHILVITDLDPIVMQTFIRVLRLPYLTRDHNDYHSILFLSWNTSDLIINSACRVVADYSDVFIMLATNDSKPEFLRANILQASRCVLLADRASITSLDGEVIDSQTIFHYLALLSIQSDFGMDTTGGLMPIVELTSPRTMKILDAEMTKRTIRSYWHRKHMLAKEETFQHKPFKHGKYTLVQQLMQQGAENLANLETSIRLRKQMHRRATMIKKQTKVSAHHGIDVAGTSILPFFAAGYGFSDDVFDIMLCQSYFTPGLIRFIYALLSSEKEAIENKQEEMENEQEDQIDMKDKVVPSLIAQIPLPHGFARNTFGELFQHLIVHEHVVAIGLFRGTGIPFSLPYVATAPSKDTLLSKDDLIFVLAQPHAIERLRKEPVLDSIPESSTGYGRGKNGKSKGNKVKNRITTPPPSPIRPEEPVHKTIESLVFQSTDINHIDGIEK